ncbi:MAG: DNA ligase [Hyphomicrobiales bacterium]|nr:DNA ligase [Hyphomicrobiales bacterium]
MRMIARCEGKAVKLYSKNGFDWSRRYPLIAEALGQLRISSIVLDGEAVILDPNGRHDFDALWSHSRDDEARMLAFDLVELNGEDYRQKPLLERKRRLARLLAKTRHGLEYVEHLTGAGATIFDHACRLGLEGIVSKHVAHPYRSGPSRSWRKVKNPLHPSIARVREAFEAERQRRKAAEGRWRGRGLSW